MIIEEDYVSFETAKLLKERGFDELTYACFSSDGEDYYGYRALGTDIMRPTLQMAMKWLREIYDLHIEITSTKSYGSDGNGHEIPLDGVLYHANIVQNNKWSNITKKFKSHSLACYCSYERACEAAIKCCLEKLI